MIERVVPDADWVRRLDREAIGFSAGQGAEFHALLMGALARREALIAAAPTIFGDVAEVAALFAEQSPDKLAMHSYNGMIAASILPVDAPTDKLAAALRDGFRHGIFLRYPDDLLTLYAPPVQEMLPGVILFLLRGQQAQSEAFAGYLRGGSRPVISEVTRQDIRRQRPVARSWEAEAAREASYRGGGA